MSSLTSVWSDLKEAFFPSVAFADEKEESPEEEAQEAQEDAEEDEQNTDEQPEESESDDSEEKADEGEEAGEDDDGDDEDENEDDDDDDDEEEDEMSDPLDSLRAKYTKTVCHSYKHHLDECIERVTKAQAEPDYEDREYKEDCIEEFFHLQHCLNDHIAPVLFAKLK